MEDAQGIVHVGIRDFSVEYKSEPVAGDRKAEDVLVLELLLPGSCGRLGIYHYDIGLDGVEGDAQPGEFIDFFGEASSSLVVFYESFGQGFERHDATGGEDSCLSHSTSHSLAVDACFFNEISGTGEHRSHGAGESFREAEHNGVGVKGDFTGGGFESVSGVEDAGAIQVDI